jgi:hypothetical protein
MTTAAVINRLERPTSDDYARALIAAAEVMPNIPPTRVFDSQTIGSRAVRAAAAAALVEFGADRARVCKTLHLSGPPHNDLSPTKLHQTTTATARLNAARAALKNLKG